MEITLVPNDVLSWGFTAVTAGAVLWIIAQHGAGFGTTDTVLRLAVIVLVSAGMFAVSLDTAGHTYLFDQTTQDASIGWAYVE